MPHPAAWTIELERRALKDLDKLGAAEARRVLAFLHGRLASIDDPRSLGEALRGSLSGLWKYRVGHYRIIADIQDRRIVIVVVRIGHRGAVYRGR